MATMLDTETQRMESPLPLNEITTHSGRRTAINNMLRCGVDLEMIREIMGWASIGAIADYYVPQSSTERVAGLKRYDEWLEREIFGVTSS